MKKVISILLLLSMLVCMIPAVSLTSYAEYNPKIEPDTSWYIGHESETEYKLYDAADLLGLAQLLATAGGTYNNVFKGKTIYIENDIDLNPGWDASTGSKPTNIWPVMPNSRDFAGTINGNSHTISGVYQENTASYAGMFGPVNGDSVTVTDLAIVNSYSKCNNADGHGMLFGTIAGNATATLSNIYVDAIVVNTDTNGGDYGVGGIIGGVISATETTDSFSMTNCVFDGTIRVNPSASGGTTYVGGLIGRYNELGTFSINNCASYGTFEATASNGAIVMIGGIMGYNSATSHSITIENCISRPTLSKNITAGDTTSQIICGSIVGASRYNSNTAFAKTKYENNICVTANIAYSGKQRVLGCGYTQTHTKAGIYCDSADYYANSIVNNSHGVDASAITGEAATTYLEEKEYTGWSVTESYPMPTEVLNMLTTPVAEIVGYQATDKEDGKFNFRIVGVLNVEEGDLENTVLSISATATYTLEGEKTLTLENYPINTVYTRIDGNSGTGLVTYTAKELGGNYIFVLPCKNVPANATDIKVEITVRYAVNDDNGTATRTLYVEAPKDAVN
ncbi:MAG: hypothetical protein IJZ83_03560 [Clostridia bacterium]|nr:hypothetical protein [Clostridia bacterium]